MSLQKLNTRDLQNQQRYTVKLDGRKFMENYSASTASDASLRIL